MARPSLPKGWVEFKQKDGGFTVFMPGPAVADKMNTVNDLKQPIPMGRALKATYDFQSPGLFCNAGVMIYSPELVDQVRPASEDFTEAGGKKTKITWLGHPASETVFENPDNHFIRVQRYVWIGNRAYHCNLFGMAAGRPTAAERATIFDSFTPGN